MLPLPRVVQNLPEESSPIKLESHDVAVRNRAWLNDEDMLTYPLYPLASFTILRLYDTLF
jgi:hypothetical protein